MVGTGELLDQGHDVNERNDFEETPLHTAINLNLVEMVRLLVDRGADLEAQEERGNTPLRISTDFHIFEFLLYRGADAMTRDNDGKTVFYWVLLRDRGPAWMRLLFKHADGDDPRTLLSEKHSTNARTALHLARTVASARWLVEYGFDPLTSVVQSTWMCPSIFFLRDNEGNTPLEHCEKLKKKEKAKYLDSFESLSLVDPATMQLSTGEAGLDQFQRFLARRVYYIVLCKIPIGHDVALRVMAFLSPADVMK